MSTYTIFLVLIVIVAFLLVVVIMVQNPKGGGLSSSFGGGGSTQIGGVQKTTDFLDKSTWALGAILLALILIANFTLPKNDAPVKSKVLDGEENVLPETPTSPLEDNENTDGAE